MYEGVVGGRAENTGRTVGGREMRWGGVEETAKCIYVQFLKMPPFLCKDLRSLNWDSGRLESCCLLVLDPLGVLKILERGKALLSSGVPKGCMCKDHAQNKDVGRKEENGLVSREWDTRQQQPELPLWGRIWNWLSYLKLFTKETLTSFGVIKHDSWGRSKLLEDLPQFGATSTTHILVCTL